jgi:integrase
MATINFLYRSTKDKANLHLRLLYRFNNIDFVFGASTKFEVSKDYWSKLHKKTNFKKTNDVIELNEIQALKEKQNEVSTELNKIENHILNAFNIANTDGVNKQWLQTQIDYYYNPPKEAEQLPTELIKYIDFYIDYRKNEIRETSKQKYNVIKQKLIRLEKFRKKVILIKDINDSFKKEFVDYCMSNKYAQNTMQRELVFIKTFCKHARFLGIETHPQLDSLRLDRAKALKIYLTFDELEAIENIDKNKLTDSLENAKDWLIISCYSGQRVSDFMRFTSDMIRKEDGQSIIEFTQKKTDKIMSVPLHPKVIEILDKRGGSFPYSISDQKYNDYIKIVCELAEITQKVTGSKLIETKSKSGIFRKVTDEYRKCDLVTSHIGRRSMATNFYGIIPTSLLINITGHSTEKMYLVYVGKSSQDLAKETFKYFK